MRGTWAALTNSIPDDNVSHMITNPRKLTGRSRARAARPPGEVDRMCVRFEEECRRSRRRITPQRRAVYRALAEDRTHPTADSLYARLRVGMMDLSLATVYRILESLEQEGFVRRVSTTEGVGRFDANLAPHQHLVCRQCGRMIDLKAEALEGISLPRRGPSGFVPERLDIRVIGTCGPCRLPGGRRRESI